MQSNISANAGADLEGVGGGDVPDPHPPLNFQNTHLREQHF